MIILEGPDGSGKTTLLRELSARYPEVPIAPRVVSKDAEAMVDLKQWTEENTALGWQNKFYDRHRLISEPIYGAVLRDKPEPGFNDFNWLSHQIGKFYRHVKPLVIYCLPPLNVVLHNLQGDKDNSVINPKAEVIYSAYVAAISRDFILRRQTTILYDYTQMQPKQYLYDDVDEIDGLIKRYLDVHV